VLNVAGPNDGSHCYSKTRKKLTSALLVTLQKHLELVII
jgi:hypothetical protein